MRQLVMEKVSGSRVFANWSSNARKLYIFSILVSAEALQCFFAFCFCNNFHDPFVMVDCMIGMPFRVVGFVSQIFSLVHHTQDLGKRAQDKLITPNP